MVYAFLFREGAVSRRRRRSSGAAPAGLRRRSELVAFRRGAAPAVSDEWARLPPSSGPGFAGQLRRGQSWLYKYVTTSTLRRPSAAPRL